VIVLRADELAALTDKANDGDARALLADDLGESEDVVRPIFALGIAKWPIKNEGGAIDQNPLPKISL
jgi:hypothetical protein